MLDTIFEATLANGVTLPYVEQGDPAGTPVILLHGYTDSYRSFESMLPHLPRSIRAIAVTQRGHGDADRPEGGYDPEDFAGDVARFMDALGIDRAVVVGHSMGSYVAQRFAVRYPDRVTGLVLEGSFPTCRGNVAVLGLRDEVARLADPIDPAFVREFQASTMASAVPEAWLDTVVGESRKMPARVWRDALDGLLASDGSGELGRISAPTLILWGDRDSFFPRGDQDVLASRIRGARLTVYEGLGHSPHWEEPERVAGDLVEFIRSARR